jgi:hypothetical protein
MFVLCLACSCKLRHLVIKKNIEGIYENVCHSLFYSRLVILTRLTSGPDNRLSSEKPFSTPVDKINFCVFEAHRWFIKYHTNNK